MKIIQYLPPISYFKAIRPQFDFGFDSAPDPTGGARRSPRPSIWIFEVLFLRGGKERKKREESEKEGQGRWEEREEKGRGQREGSGGPKSTFLATPSARSHLRPPGLEN